MIDRRPLMIAFITDEHHAKIQWNEPLLIDIPSITTKLSNPHSEQL